MYSCTVGSVQDEMISLIEAIETHGKLVNINFTNLPKSVRDKIIAQGEKEGMSKDQIEAMMAAADMESDKADDQFSSGGQAGKNSLCMVMMHLKESTCIRLNYIIKNKMKQF